MVEEVEVVVRLDQEAQRLNQLNQEIQDHLVKVLLEELLRVRVCKVEAVVAQVPLELTL